VFKYVTTAEGRPGLASLAIICDDNHGDSRLTRDIGFSFYHPYNEHRRDNEGLFRNPHYTLSPLMFQRLEAHRDESTIKRIFDLQWDDDAQVLYESGLAMYGTILKIKQNDMATIHKVIDDFGLDLTTIPNRLRDHQLQALALNIYLGYSDNWGQMRTGKTPPTIVYLYSLYMRQEIDVAICVVTNSTKHIWHKELGKFTNSIVPVVSQVIEGTKAKKKELWYKSGIFKIVNYESLRSDIETVHEYLDGDVELGRKPKRYALCLDECHNVKNESSQTAAVQSLVFGKNKPVALVALSGTPVANKPHDVARVIQMTAPDTIGKNYPDFISNFCITNGYNGHSQVTGYRRGALDNLHNIMARFSVRALREQVNMELGKIVYPEELVMSARQRKIHDDLRDTFRTQLYEMDDMSVVQVSGFLAQVMKLQEITGGFIIDAYKTPHFLEDKENPKLMWIDNFIKEYLDDWGKVVISCKFRAIIQTLENRYAKYGATSIYGGVRPEERSERMERFTQTDDCRIMILNAKTAEGLDLNPCHVIIQYTKDFQPKVNWQCEDRITGFHQKEEATIIPLLCENSVDTNLEVILEQKQKWFDAVMGDDGKTTPQSIPGGLNISKDDLFALLR